jgi:hypothetical protein
MVRPITKISPIIFIAAPTAWRTNGSPARHQPLERAAALTDQRAPDDQAPGRRIDQHRTRLAGVRAPVGVAQLVGDQQVGGFGVGHAQERLGQAQQRDAFR